MRRINELQASNKRQQTIIERANREGLQLKAEIEEMKQKLQERERVHGQNKDLVTKNCGQQSAIDQLRRQVQELKAKLELMNNERHKLESQQKQRGTAVVPRVYKLA